MLDSYRRVLARPGALAFSSAGLVARLPDLDGRARASCCWSRSAPAPTAWPATVSAVLRAGRRGVRRPARPAGRPLRPGARAAARRSRSSARGLRADDASRSSRTGARAWTYVFAAVAGAALPQVGACVRARWSHVLDDPATKQTAFALEAVLDEVVFIVGPILVTVLATGWHPVAGLAVALVTGVGRHPRLRRAAAHRAARRRSRRPAGRGRRCRGGSSLPLAVVCLALGVLFGAAEVTTVAFAEEQGQRWAAGGLLAAWALGSLVAGLVTGAIAWRSGPDVRVRWGSAAMALAMAPLLFVDSVPVMAVVLLVGGLAIAPTMIGAMSMIEQVVPAGRLTEGMAILHTGHRRGRRPGREHRRLRGRPQRRVGGVRRGAGRRRPRRARRPDGPPGA